jgi:hypothetical protein
MILKFNIFENYENPCAEMSSQKPEKFIYKDYGENESRSVLSGILKMPETEWARSFF